MTKLSIRGRETVKLTRIVILSALLVCGTIIRAIPQFDVSGSGRFAAPIRISTAQAELLNERAGAFESLAANTGTKATDWATKSNLDEATLTLHGGVTRATSAVESLKRDFEERGDKRDSSDQRVAAEIFFDSIEKNLKYADDFTNQYGMDKFSVAKDTTVAALNGTSSVFKAVANSGFLTFDLEVDSDPQDADVSYKRTAGSYTPHPNQTNTTIQNLAYAVWIVRVVKSRYQPQEKRHDPFRERNHLMHFTLVK